MGFSAGLTGEVGLGTVVLGVAVFAGADAVERGFGVGFEGVVLATTGFGLATVAVTTGLGAGVTCVSGALACTIVCCVRASSLK